MLSPMMGDRQTHVNSLFLNEESSKPLGSGGRVQRLRHALEKRAGRARKRMYTLTWESTRAYLQRNAFVLLTVSAVLLGITLALALRPYRMTYRQIKYFSFPGELLMRMLQMLVLPLIVSSLITGMASLDGSTSGKMGMRAVIYYMMTTILAVFTGIFMVLIIHPGKGSKEKLHREGKIEQVHTTDAFMDLIRNMFPPNLVEACFRQYKTQYSVRIVNQTLERTSSPVAAPPVPQLLNHSVGVWNATPSPTALLPLALLENATAIWHNVTQALSGRLEGQSYEEVIPGPGSVNGVNALGLVVFSICFGLVIGSMKQKGQALREFFDCLNEAILRMVAIIIWYAPIGILFLIAGKILEMEDLAVMGGQLGMYTLTVIVGLLIHGLCVLPLIYFIITHKNPWVFVAGLLQALVTAMGTSSSSATLPVTFRCLEENIGVDKRITRFVLPVGATINMDGTALYEALAAIFIAQVNNYELDFGQIITISITATAASIGAAGIPQAGLVTMVIVLTSVGLPTEDITLIMAVDWFLFSRAKDGESGQDAKAKGLEPQKPACLSYRTLSVSHKAVRMGEMPSRHWGEKNITQRCRGEGNLWKCGLRGPQEQPIPSSGPRFLALHPLFKRKGPPGTAVHSDLSETAALGGEVFDGMKLLVELFPTRYRIWGRHYA